MKTLAGIVLYNPDIERLSCDGMPYMEAERKDKE